MSRRSIAAQARALRAEKQRALEVRFPQLRKSGLIKAPAPPARTVHEAGRLVLGQDKTGAAFVLSPQLLAAHTNIVGGIGGGKSVCMRHLAWQHMESPDRLNTAEIVIDPHGSHRDSLFRTTCRRVLETRLYQRKKVYVIDPNSEFCTGLNLLDSEAGASVVADNAIEGFERLQGDEDLFEKPTLRRALHGLLAVLAELKLTLAEADLLLDPLDPHGIREWALHHAKDRYARKALLRLQYLSSNPRLLKEFEVETIGTENRLAALLCSPAIRATVGSPMLDMLRVLDEGAVLLINTAGGNAASEIAGDQFGKLVLRQILFAAKRRRTNSLALVFCDEIPRYASRDFERALAELRKYRVGLVSAHQTFAMLGEPGDPVREAIEKIPATKIAFRLNSMQEAAMLAPDLMQLNLEMPVKLLVKPSVVGDQATLLRNGSVSTSAGTTDTAGTGVTDSRSETTTAGANWGTAEMTGVTRSASRAVAIGEAETTAETRSITATEGGSETDSESESESYSSGSGGSHSDEQSWSQDGGRGTSYTRSADPTSTEWGDVTNSRSTSAGRSGGSGDTTSWSDGENHSTASAHASTASWSRAEGLARTQSSTRSKTVTESEGRADSEATTHSRGGSTSQGNTKGRAVSHSASRANSQTQSHSAGWSEAYRAVYADLPTAVHSLQNVTHLSAELLCSLPTGTCIVRTIRDGRIEGAVVRVPERACPPVSDEQYAADLRLLVEQSGRGMLMHEAVRQIEARERDLIATASSLKVVHSSEEFRQPLKKKTGTSRQVPSRNVQRKPGNEP
jgi:hypothetical protein